MISSIASASTVGQVLANRRELGLDIGEASVGFGDSVVECDDGVVETGADPTDVGVDVGDALADLVVEPGLEPVHPFRDPFLTRIDTGADDVGHLGLLARGCRRDFVDPHHDVREALVEAARHVRGDPLEAGVDGRRDRIDVVDHLAGLLVELADAAIEGAHVGFDPVLAVLDFLEDRSCGRFDRRSDSDVRFIDDSSESQVHLVVALLGRRTELVQACLEELLEFGLIGPVRRLRTLQGTGESLYLLFELDTSRSTGAHLVAELGEIRRDIATEPGQLLLYRAHDLALHLLKLFAHRSLLGWNQRSRAHLRLHTTVVRSSRMYRPAVVGS